MNEEYAFALSVSDLMGVTETPYESVKVSDLIKVHVNP